MGTVLPVLISVSQKLLPAVRTNFSVIGSRLPLELALVNLPPLPSAFFRAEFPGPSGGRLVYFPSTGYTGYTLLHLLF